MSSAKDDFKSMENMLKTVNEQMKNMKTLYDDTIINEYHLNLAVAKELKKFTKEDVDKMELNEILRVLNDSSTKDHNNVNCSHEYYDNLENEEEFHSKLATIDGDTTIKNKKEYIDVMKDVFKEIISYNENYHSLMKDTRKIENQINKAYDDYFAYLNSDEVVAKKSEKLAKMEEEANKIEDAYDRNKLLEKINAIKNSKDISFLLERFVENGNKEATNIYDTFFDSNRSSIILNKYKIRMKQLGFDSDIFQKFYNIEENFLDEKYYDLNNIFLFTAMRFISYANINNEIESLHVRSVINAMYKLVYHKFDTEADEKNILDVITKIDDYFMPYIQIFTEKNVTSPNHPRRKIADEEHDQKVRMLLIASLENRGEKVDSTQSTEILKKQLEDLIKAEKNELDQEIEADEKENNELSSEDINEDNNETDISEDLVVDDIDNLLDDDTITIEEVSDAESNHEEIYKNEFGWIYKKNPETSLYDYYNDNNELVEGESIDESTLLQLMSGGNLTKIYI